MPASFIRLSFRHPLPLLERAFLVPVSQQSGPDFVSTDIFDPEVVQILDRTRDLHIKVHLRCAFIVPLAGSEERLESLAAIGVKKRRSYDKSLVWRGWVDVNYLVSFCSQSRYRLFQSTSAGGCRIDDTYMASANTDN